MSVPVPGTLQSVATPAGWALTSQVFLLGVVMEGPAPRWRGAREGEMLLQAATAPAGTRAASAREHREREVESAFVVGWEGGACCQDAWRRSSEDKRKEEIVRVRQILEVCVCAFGCARYELACLQLNTPWSSEKTETVLPVAKTS